MAKVEKVDDTYYWVDSYITCDCDKMYCPGCKTAERRLEIKEQVTDCPKCEAKQSVVPTYSSIPEPRMKRRIEGQTTREGYIMRCSLCGKAP